MIENQEGTVVEGQETDQGAQENSPASSTSKGTQNSPAGGANSGASDVPFHKNPEFQDYLGRQKKSWDRDWGTKLSEMQSTYDKKLQDLQTSMKQPGQSLSEQDATQLRQLVKLIKSDPEAARELGLTDLQGLKSEIENLRSTSSEASIEKEAHSVVSEMGPKYGYKPEEFETKLWEFIRDDDYWSNQPFTKGIFKKAAVDFVSQNSQELAERAANMKLVTQNQDKGKAGSQRPVGSGQQTKEEAPTSMRQAIRQSMKRNSEGVALGS